MWKTPTPTPCNPSGEINNIGGRTMARPFDQGTKLDLGIEIDVYLSDPTSGTASMKVNSHERADADPVGALIILPRRGNEVIKSPSNRRDVRLNPHDPAFRTNPICRNVCRFETGQGFSHCGYKPRALLRSSARSVFSQVNESPVRPK